MYLKVLKTYLYKSNKLAVFSIQMRKNPLLSIHSYLNKTIIPSYYAFKRFNERDNIGIYK